MKTGNNIANGAFVMRMKQGSLLSLVIFVLLMAYNENSSLIDHLECYYESILR